MTNGAAAGGSGAGPGHGLVLVMFGIAVLIHLFDMFTKFSAPHIIRAMIYIVFAIMAALLLFRGIGFPRSLEVCLIISAVAFLLPWLFWVVETAFFGMLSNLPLSSIINLEVVSWLMILFPVWALVIAIQFFEQSPNIMKIVVTVYLLFLVIFFLYQAFAGTPWTQDALYLQDFSPEEAAKTFREAVVESATELTESIAEVGRSFRMATERQIKYATGDHYTGQVDKNAEEPLGVYIEKVEPASPFFYKDETAILWGRLKARTIDQDKPLSILLWCDGLTGEMTQGRPDAVPPISPQPIRKKGYTNIKGGTKEATTLFGVDQYEYADLTCQFDPGTFKEGSRQATFHAQFPFETNSYQKAYFMELELLRGLKRQNVDPFSHFQIKDKNPKAVFSNGPVEIGMGLREPLIGIDSTSGSETEFRLSGSLKNRWTGKILVVDSLVIKVPNGMEIILEECNVNLIEIECSSLTSSSPLFSECENGKYESIYRVLQASEIETVYTTETTETPDETVETTIITDNIVRRGLDHLKGKHIEGSSHVPFACNVKVNDIQAILGGVPLATQYFKVSADYTYELEKSATLTIKKQPLGEVGATP